jgi:hypothetical protein
LPYRPGLQRSIVLQLHEKMNWAARGARRDDVQTLLAEGLAPVQGDRVRLQQVSVPLPHQLDLLKKSLHAAEQDRVVDLAGTDGFTRRTLYDTET